MAHPRIGFIGLGLMGHGMAKNLVAKGFPLTVKVNRDRSRLAGLLAGGAKEARTNAEVARASDMVILCVNGSPQVEECALGADGLLEAARAGLVVLDTSTSEPQSTLKLHRMFAARGAAFVDAPLGRTPKEADEGRLTSMVGADDATFERVQPVLEAFCEKIFHVGPPGAGHTLKLVNNFLALTLGASIAEAFAVAAKANVKLDKLFEVVSLSTFNSRLLQLIAGNAVKGDFTGMQFAIANAAKDMRYYTHLAESLPVASYIGEAVHQSFEQAVALGLGDKLVGSMIEAQETLNNVRIVQAAKPA